MKIALATTTINVPYLLLEYSRHANIFMESNDHEIFFVIAGDRKTPNETMIFCKELQEIQKIEVTYLDPDVQRIMLGKNNPLDSHLDWDCIQRRNLAGLFALRKHADVIIYIDDDNYIDNSNYFSDHISVISEIPKSSIESTNGFYNIMNSAKGKRTGDWLFPRGYPFSLRADSASSSQSFNTRQVGVNAGLWLEEPDIDAISRISGKPIVESYSFSGNLCLSKGTWTPINSQNTLFLSKLLPAYFLSSKVGRYDDIYAGYILQKVMDRLGYATSFGAPFVRQKRNEHDLLLDLQHELNGMKNIDFFVNFLRDFELKSSNVIDCVLEIKTQIQLILQDLPKNHFAVQDLRNLALGFHLWVESISQKL